ncbi:MULTISPECIES: helix-turn-helix transcriptional regulator [Bacillus cereus group]|uniref:helix-turn-helix transcriptional regulator n=1 Tax=Bacillus cereus group TaxID=86661 RepID=UPI000BFE7E8D|nr:MULTISPECIES: helix-turn-helix domain-containing protein [Bacillus cereus group]MCR6790082.1 helix-turn-helix domain-containing protein [Bacillus thuringiensis]MCR6820557.1 helix-turn-helix domain-containing protein [Bacillus thuringiensis]MCR6832049.1 helix-turn-helix domain-containing protein [Bacillus thuringiensis]MEB8931624.1 helix-turn-helix domain-containing protein [Bacillus cereus]MEB9915203.1 helix-turn-helix domain-containing protein [Bacillus cereus]
MNKELIIELISMKIKLIRTEKGYTQDKMAEVLGISKKTLVQIEKGRSNAGWTNSVAICALFRDSEVLQSTLGDDPLVVIETMAHKSINNFKEKTLGGKVWWKQIQERGHFRLQQNLISQHYRILDEHDYRWFSSFDREDALDQLATLTRELEK